MRDTPPPYRTVVFDCDSTLSAIEGVDELGAAHRAEIEALTNAAMSGALKLEDVYARRLALIAPSQVDVERIGALYVERAVPHARELVRALKARGKRVCIVSGGLAPAVNVLAHALGIHVARNVRAVTMEFDARGAYAGFDAANPLARTGGKIEVVREFRAIGFPLALVGDGITDLEAGEAEGGADRFIAYGGVVKRAAVFARAHITCETKTLAGLVPLLFSPDEVDALARDPEHAALVSASRNDASRTPR